MMGIAMRSIGRVLAMMLMVTALPAAAQSVDEGLIVVYGAQAQTREGDVDRREQIFFSIPSDTSGRVFVRLFDPEIFGQDDFTYGGPRDSVTTFRVFGADGAFSAADRPEMVEDRARADRARPDFPVTGPGRVVLERAYDSDRNTDGRWVTLGAVRARQGEQLGGRSYFRIDVEGTRGNDGNGFSVNVSRARDRDRAPDGLQLFSYQPTIRWTRAGTATRVGFEGTQGPYSVQSFDAANGDIAIVTDYEDLRVQVSGQDFWTVDSVDTSEDNLALSLAEGFETPNDVTVAVFDGTGAPVALNMPPRRTLDPARPTAVGTGRPLANCQSVAFDGSRSIGRDPLSYVWEFGDGNSAAEPVIAHLYDQPGRYTAILKVLEEGGRPGAGASVEVPVHVRAAPVAQPGAAIVVAPGEVIPFDGTASQPSDSPITRYVWSFGDGEQVEGPLAQKQYAQPGAYRVVLRVSDDSLHPCNFGVATRDITVNFSPVAEAGTDQTAKVGQTVSLNGSASYDVDGNVGAYVWDMGDGTTLNGVAVQHQYAEPGRYTVALTVTDDSGVANAQASDTLVIGVNSPPEPAIVIPDRPASVGEAALLDGSGSTDADGVILSYLWEFGDGAMGEGEAVSYAWTAPGVYTVALTVTDNSGTASATQRTTRQIVIDAAPVANAGPDQYVTASEVQFDGTGSVDPDGTISAYEWRFGDGGTATGPRPVHAFARPGIYEVALVVRDASGAPLNSNRDTMLVTVNATPIADAGPPQVVAPDEEFVLSARSSLDPDGAISAYEWQLPSGATMDQERIGYAISEPGTYRIGLSVFDSFTGGAARDDDDVLITVNAAPVAEAGANLLVAPGDPVVLDASQSFDIDGQIVSYLWEFDDGFPAQTTPQVTRSYDTPGTWSVQLVVTDQAGVANSTDADDMTVRVNAAPVAEAGPNIETDVLQVTVDASASADADGDALVYTWDMGDGSAPRMGRTVTHVYPRSGKFPVTLRVNDGTGLSNATAIDATTVVVNARPLADAGGNRDVCSGESILFDASDSVDPDGGLLLYSWDFGDGSTSDLINPTKIYENPGAYPVTLRVRNGKGTEWGSDVDRIAVLVREGPIANAGEDLVVYTNQPVRFDGSGSTDADGAVNAFSWTMGDGGTASGERPEYRFKNPGNYPVTLTIQGEAVGDCSPLDTDTANVQVLPAPEQVIVAEDRAAAGLPATFVAQVTDLDGATVTAQEWTFSDGGTATGDSVDYVFAEPGIYFANLVTRLEGLSSGLDKVETRRKVIVNEAPMAGLDGPDRIAVGAAAVFDASASVDADGALTGFAWDFGDGTTASGVAVAHAYNTPGTYTLRLTVMDDAGVGNSAVTVERMITVNPAPSVGLEVTQQICTGIATPWSVSVDETTSVSWRFGDGTTATGASVSHSFGAPGLYPVTVSLDDGKGLLNSRRSEEVYVRVNATPTAIAGPDQIVNPGEAVQFDASASGDLDGALIDYVWTFSDGVTLNGAQVERSFDASGPVTVELSARDDSGSACATDTDTLRVLVNSSPSVDAGPDRDVPVGAAHDVVVFDASDAVDADGHGLSIQWDFGDGTTASGAIVRHAYSAPGSYTVTVTASDTTGLSSGSSVDTATVNARARGN
ncbi:PKD domain-containing protein [uncultured Tateyamaria sp.]|uniref:PKD domain-containing protein n=1 Tax=uncultured Tateyamaria sp. TaxID=455651 RepID=UPI00260F9D08|nr:PKD domain-containing protein [uncultured Tateyamaria sp.]